MARIVSISGERRTPLDAGWALCETEAGAFAGPDQADGGGDWLPAIVPGAVAAALAQSGRFDREKPRPLHQNEFWFRRALTGEGPALLRFDGLATLCDIFLDGRLIARSQSMFLPLEIAVDLKSESRLHLRFRPLVEEALPKASRRQRWRPHLVADAWMRQARSTLLGHMPGWCPDIHCIGPWRPVTLIRHGAVRASDARLEARLEGREGVLSVSLALEGGDAPPALACAGYEAPMRRGADGRFSATLRIPDVPRWAPAPLGQPNLHAVTIRIGDAIIDLGRTGFRDLKLDRGATGEGFAMLVNGEKLFCRGAVWTTPDLLSLPGSRATLEPLMRLAVEAGMNMLRAPGLTFYESDDFYQLADELGLLIWQDLPLANFDYDFALHGEATPFEALAQAELEALLDRTQASPALAVVCGGSEIAQQAAMLGLGPERRALPFLEQRLPEIVAAAGPDGIAVPSTPWGGDLPFHVNSGVGHYFGVGAYCRPLEDARRARVTFATECLAFANLPQPAAMAEDHAGLDPASPDWKARVVRDLKAVWDFEDTRDFYLALLYGVDPGALKRNDPARYIELSQAVPGEVMEQTFAEWRRARSETAGALAFLFSDIGPGFGWGVVDWRGEPKPPYYALKRAFRPVQVLIIDEGVNGLDVHVLNETGEQVEANLSLACFDVEGATVIDGRKALILPPRSAQRIAASDLFGQFFDAGYAYRFGPPAHEAVVARLEGGGRAVEAFHFPLGRGLPTAELSRSVAGLGQHAPLAGADDFRRDAGLAASLHRDAAGWFVRLTTRRLAQSVHIAAAGFRPDDDWFHLAPGRAKIVRLTPAGAPKDAAPQGAARALNGLAPARFG